MKKNDLKIVEWSAQPLTIFISGRKQTHTHILLLCSRVGPDTGYWNYQAEYPVLSYIQPYFAEVIRPDIRQFSLL